MGEETQLPPILNTKGLNSKLPPVKGLLDAFGGADNDVAELQKELAKNKSALVETIRTMSEKTNIFDYASIISLEEICSLTVAHLKNIRVKMIKHDSMQAQKENGWFYFDQTVPPSWFQFKRDGPKYCVHCECVDTIEWRNGPWGKSTLCNACGLWYRKLRKKFTSEECTIIMEERRLFSDKTDRKERIEFAFDPSEAETIRASVKKRMNIFLREVDIFNSTKMRLRGVSMFCEDPQKVAPLEMNKYDSISRIC